MKKKIYIAGKITGDPDFKQKFERVAHYFRARGYAVLNPTVLSQDGMLPADYMRICLPMVDSSDIVYFLSDYVNSNGAQIEFLYAKYIGKEIVLESEVPCFG